jgi:hypothetical protein
MKMHVRYTTTTDETRVARTRRVNQTLARLLWIGLLTGVVAAQTQPAVPPKTPNLPLSEGAYGNWLFQAGVMCGAGASTSSIATKPTGQCGGLLSFPFFDLEAGALGPQTTSSAVSGYLSTNLWIPLTHLQDLGNKLGVPLAVGGYTRVFGTENALNYGVAYAHPVDISHSIQVELRDYWAFSSPHQHDVVFRIVWLIGIPD